MRDWRHNNSVRTPYFGSCGVLLQFSNKGYYTYDDDAYATFFIKEHVMHECLNQT